MDHETFWQHVNNSGLKIRADYTDPSKWVGSIRGKHIGPYSTREEVVVTAIRWLITEVEDTDEQIEAYRGEKQRGSLLEAFASVVRSIFS
ncbi:MAG: hypothetical protein HC828_08215 [Blastochloris sp.]|nr:hypothetical protein [Blastochloris sp.]